MQIFEDLKNSGYMGCINEAGLGVPLTAWLTSHDGASKVLYKSTCRYHKNTQPTCIGTTSVSEEMAARIAWEDHSENRNEIEKLGKTPFSLCITGAFKKEDEQGESHAWVSLYYDEGSRSLMHFRLRKGMTRETAIMTTLDTILWFMSNVLLYRGTKWNETLDYIQGLPVNIDVIKSRGFAQEHLLEFCNKNNPLFFGTDGVPRRAVSHIRQNVNWFRGSFRPVTDAHDYMALKSPEDPIFEISLTNVRKMMPTDLKDISHRISMINSLGYPVLVTFGYGKFVEFDEMLTSFGCPEVRNYVMGLDTYNAVVADKYCPTEDYLDPLKTSALHVFMRNSKDLDRPPRSNSLNIVTHENPKFEQVSSTESRKNLSNLPTPVVDYIRTHNLYGDE